MQRMRYWCLLEIVWARLHEPLRFDFHHLSQVRLGSHDKLIVNQRPYRGLTMEEARRRVNIDCLMAFGCSIGVSTLLQLRLWAQLVHRSCPRDFKLLTEQWNNPATSDFWMGVISFEFALATGTISTRSHRPANWSRTSRARERVLNWTKFS
jgi:hypothetical protein